MARSAFVVVAADVTGIIKEERIGGQRLILGDCLEVMPLLSDKPDSAVTDPPYGVNYSGSLTKRRDGKMTKRPGGGYGSFEDTPEYVQDFAVQAVKTLVNVCRSVAVTPGTRCAHLYPPPDDMGCFYISAGAGLGRWGFTCSQPILFYGRDPYLMHGKGGRPNSFAKDLGSGAKDVGHPCAKPSAWMDWLVNRVTWPGDLVIDPFMGSGSTLVACAKLGRAGIGIEIDPEYFEIACRRVEEATRQPDMFVAAPEQPKQETLL